MAIIRESTQPPLNEEEENQIIKFTCPVCQAYKFVNIPKSVINSAHQLTTVSIPKGLVCHHHFQAFVDKNFVIRGYQKVDFELAYDLLQKKNAKMPYEDFHKELLIDGNYIGFTPLDLGKLKKMKKEKLFIKEEILSNPLNKTIEAKEKPKYTKSKSSMSLKEIYDEFWELIDDNNEEFKHFIELDDRRKKKNGLSI